MPTLAIAAVGAGVAWGVGELATGAVIAGLTVSATTATLLGSVAGLLVTTGLSLAFNRPKPTATQASETRFATFASGIAPRQIVYGRALVTGPMVYAGSFGAQNDFMHVIVPVAGHAIQGFDAIWINDFRIPLSAAMSANGDGTTGAGIGGVQGLYTDVAFLIPKGTEAGSIDPANVVRSPDSIGTFEAGDVQGEIWCWDGTQVVADSNLVADIPSEWTNDHIGLECAYVHVKVYIYNNMLANGVSTVAAEIRGKVDVLDIRDATPKYTNNPALCILDYLQSDFGLSASDDEIDEDFWIAAANICDEDVATDAGATTFQNRYELDGSFRLDTPPVDIVEQMLTSMAGTLPYVAGKYRLYAGAYDAPTVSITVADFAGGISIVTNHSRQDQFNTIDGNYIEPQQAWAAIAFPRVQSSAALADDGEEVAISVSFPFTIDVTRVQRIARLRLLAHRVAGLRVEATYKYGMLRLCVWDTVALTFAEFGWTSQIFRCTAFRFDPVSGLVTATLQGEDSAAYTWLYSDAEPPVLSPSTGLVSPFVLPAMLAPTLTPFASGGLSFIDVAWTPAASPYAAAVEVQWRRSNPSILNYEIWFGNQDQTSLSEDADWNSTLVGSSATNVQIVPAVAGMAYSVRIRARNDSISGPWSPTVTTIAV